MKACFLSVLLILVFKVQSQTYNTQKYYTPGCGETISGTIVRKAYGEYVISSHYHLEGSEFLINKQNTHLKK